MTLGYLFKFDKGLSITKENLQEDGIPCITYGEVHSKYGFEFNPSDNPLKSVSEDYLLTDLKSLLNLGDFVFADTSEDLEGSGNFSYLNMDEMAFAGYHTVIAKAKTDMNHRYYAYLMTCSGVRSQVRSRVSGTKVYSITQKILKEIRLLIPHVQEQEDVVIHLDKECSKIDRATYSQKRQIEKLKEYKTTLIDSAVTGKIKV